MDVAMVTVAAAVVMMMVREGVFIWEALFVRGVSGCFVGWRRNAHASFDLTSCVGRVWVRELSWKPKYSTFSRLPSSASGRGAGGWVDGRSVGQLVGR